MSAHGPCVLGCQLGHGRRCFAARTTRRLCELIAAGRDDYRDYVERQTMAGAVPAEDAAARRAGKPRVPLGTKLKPP